MRRFLNAALFLLLIIVFAAICKVGRDAILEHDFTEVGIATVFALLCGKGVIKTAKKAFGPDRQTAVNNNRMPGYPMQRQMGQMGPMQPMQPMMPTMPVQPVMPVPPAQTGEPNPEMDHVDDMAVQYNPYFADVYEEQIQEQQRRIEEQLRQQKLLQQQMAQQQELQRQLLEQQQQLEQQQRMQPYPPMPRGNNDKEF